MRTEMLMQGVAQDLRYALRIARSKPGFTLAIVLVAAVSIGSTTAVFSIVDRILFRSLPYGHDQELVSVGVTAPFMDQEFLFGTTYLEWRRSQTAFQSMTSWSGVKDCDLTGKNSIHLRCAQIESTFLPAFGVWPLLGRNFTQQEDQPSGPKVALLSYGFWRSLFGGDPNIVGRIISVDGQTVEVIGVLPRQFELPTLADFHLAIPQALDEATQIPPNQGRPIRVFARLKPDMSVEQATGAIQSLFSNFLKSVPSSLRNELKLRVRSIRSLQTENSHLVSWILFGSVVTMLLLACANVSNLLLVRSVAREKEMAIRSALGATRIRIVRQVLVESLMLSLSGAVLGIFIGYSLLHLFILVAPEGIPRLATATLDGRILLFTLGVSLFSGLLFGMAPAFAHPSLEWLSSWHSSGARQQLSRNMFVAAQMALSLILLTGAVLLLRSWRNLENTPLGVQPRGVFTADLLVSQSHAAGQVALNLFEAIENKLKNIPGISVAVSDSLPPDEPARARPLSAIQVASHAPLPRAGGSVVFWRSVTPDYFSVLGISIVRGRAFMESDRNPGQGEIIPSRSFSRQLFGNEDPIGKRIAWTGENWYTVVGVAEDVKNNGIAGQDMPEYYVPRMHSADEDVYQYPNALHRANIAVRGLNDSRAAGDILRSTIEGIDPSLKFSIEAMTQRTAKFTERPRFNALLLSTFAGLGVILAVVGLYTVISFAAAQRTRDIAVRIAMGATPKRISTMMLALVARWVVGGAVVGFIASLFVTRSFRSLLFGISANDPGAMIFSAMLLLATAALAGWIPSRRASYIDPARALREQ